MSIVTNVSEKYSLHEPTHSLPLVLGPYLDLHFPELHHSIVVEHTAFWALLYLLASALQDTAFFCWFLQRSFELHGVPNSELLSSHSRTWVPFLGIVWSYLDIDAETISPMHFNFKLFLSSRIRTTTFFRTQVLKSCQLLSSFPDIKPSRHANCTSTHCSRTWGDALFSLLLLLMIQETFQAQFKRQVPSRSWCKTQKHH